MSSLYRSQRNHFKINHPALMAMPPLWERPEQDYRDSVRFQIAIQEALRDPRVWADPDPETPKMRIINWFKSLLK